MPSDADTFHDREHGGVTVLAHRGAFIRHSQALGMNLSMPHAAWTGADQAVETRCGLAGSVRSGKEIITPAEHCLSLIQPLFDRDTLCQVAWLINIRAFQDGHVVGQQL
jgi:hypothetical protein